MKKSLRLVNFYNLFKTASGWFLLEVDFLRRDIKPRPNGPFLTAKLAKETAVIYGMSVKRDSSKDS